MSGQSESICQSISLPKYGFVSLSSLGSWNSAVFLGLWFYKAKDIPHQDNSWHLKTYWAYSRWLERASWVFLWLILLESMGLRALKISTGIC